MRRRWFFSCRERQHEPSDVARWDRVELLEDQRIGEEHRVVAERLRRHQRDAEYGAAAVVGEAQAEGLAKQAEGKARNAVGKMKDGVRDAVDKLKDTKIENEEDRTIERDKDVA